MPMKICIRRALKVATISMLAESNYQRRTPLGAKEAVSSNSNFSTALDFSKNVDITTM